MMNMRTNRQVCAVSGLVCTLLLGAGGLRGTLLTALQNARQDSALSGQTMTLLSDGRRLLTGGANAEGPVSTMAIDDPGSSAPYVLPTRLQRARAWHSATVLPDGTVLIFGGTGPNGRPVDVTERFDPATGTMSRIGSLGVTPRAGHTATLLTDGRVLIAGGATSSGDIAATEAWNVSTGTTERALGGLTHPRRGHTAALTADGDVWVSGGVAPSGARITEGELFVAGLGQFVGTAAPPATDAWAMVSGALPADNESGVPASTIGAVRFTAPVDLRSVSPTSVTLAGPEGFVGLASVVSAEGGRLAFITPRSLLRPSTEYALTVNGVIGPDGNPVPPATFTWRTEDLLSQPDDATIASDERAVPRDPAGRPRSPWQDAPPLQAEPGVTAMAGQVLRLNGQPLADVTFEIDGQVTHSDASGRFLLPLDHADTQHHELLIDGATATAEGRAYGVFEVGVTVTGGRTNVLPYTIWMPALDTAHAVPIPSPTTTEVVVTTPRIPGLEVRIPPGTVIRDHDGNVVRELSITPIPIDQPPFPLPPDLDVPVYFTIQPGAAYVSTSGINVTAGARLIYPNGLGLRVGRRMAFWHYDPEDKGWYVYGQGTVTGSQIVPDPRVAVYEFTGAMVADPDFGPAEGPPVDGDSDGDPVDLSTGLFVYSKTDLVVADVIPIAIARTYRPRDSRMRAFGVGTSHEYEMFLVGATNPWTYVELILPDGGRLKYERISAGSDFRDAVFEHTGTPTRFYKSTIRYATGFGVGWDLRLRDGTVYSFPDSEGASTPRRAALVRIRDRNGNDVVLTRDANWNLTQVTSRHGRWIRLTYDSLNRITRAEDNIGRIVQYTYDSVGRLQTVTDEANGVTEFTYDTQHRMLTVKDPRGITYLTNDYDANGRVILQTQADSTTYQFAYTLKAGRVVQTDVTDPRGFVRRLTFNGSGYTLTDTRAHGTPDAQTTAYERQAGTSLPLTVTDGLNRKTRYTYDTNGNVLTITQLADTADNVTTTLTYEPTFSQITSITNPLGHATTFTYDTRGNPVGITDANGNRTTVTHDALGRPIATTDGAGNQTRFVYLGGDLYHVINPVGDTTTRDVDGIGRVTRLTDGRGVATQYEYNAFNRITRITDAATGETMLTYDPNGSLLTLTDARNDTMTYTYDTMDRVATRVDPLLRGESFLYDANGNLQRVADRKNQITTYTYDSLNRLETATYADDSRTTSTFDAGDRLIQVVDALAGTIMRGYDLLDRLTSETTPEGTVSYSYDAAGRRETMTVAGQPMVSYSYDNAGRLAGMTQSAVSVSAAYDAADRRTSLTLPNGVTVEYAYDAASRLTALTYTAGAGPLGHVSYTYDGAGYRTAVGGTWARPGLPAALASATYDAANQAITFGGTLLTYDANGNLTSDGTRTYTWNARNELSALSGGVTASFQYDGVGRRRAKTIGGGTTGFLYDGLNMVQELAGGAPSANLLPGLDLDEVFTRTDATGARHFLADALGSTLALTDAAGTVQTQYTYQPFGATATTGPVSTNAFQFTGRENDGTGLYYYRARYYSPATQRFISEDHLGVGGGDGNSYAYVRNDPLNRLDPSGNTSIAGGLIGTGAVFGGVAQGLCALAGGMSPGAVAREALAGAVAGALGAGAGLLTGTAGGGPAAAGAAANGVYGAVLDGIHGHLPSVGGLAADAAVGAI